MIIDTLNLINRTSILCLNETDENKIIGTFTELAVSVLNADFGFVWMNKKNDTFELAYKSRNMPYTPLSPTQNGRNIKVFKNFRPDFVSTVAKRNDVYDVSRYMKSFVIIPIAYQQHIYGNAVICFKKPEKFSKEKRISCAIIGNNIAQVITILRAKHTLKEIEEYKRNMREEELRTEFLADAMHEIRTPLAIIKGTVDLALHPYSIDQSVALKAIHAEVEHLTEILSELSVLTSKNSPVRRKMQTKKIQLAPFIQEISKRWTALANMKNVSIKIQKMPRVSILADESYLSKLFTNIIKNAITYGKKNGYIKISGTVRKDMIVIDIEDNGIGISQTDLERIFDRFYRADKSRTSLENNSGTGLGLAIVKWIAEAHGGTVTATSTLGKGSVFTVSLPRA
ncbi:MAG TPA: GAF domain-containing sensor histidine kinase [Candidatus Paceibacterota bacterium]|jgi:K+-sensing histidine kinase KdpD|nr:GAF domain-containing sensor histidine kinase [Candidatus Paceibacterota bacterium]